MTSPDADNIARSATEAILESVSDGVFTVDPEWRITSFNRAAEETTGVPRDEAIGRRCCEVFRSNMCEVGCALRETMVYGDPIVNRAAFIVHATGRRIPITVSTAVLRDGQGRVVGGVETFRDLSLVEELRKELDGRGEAGGMVSHSPAMRRIFAVLPQVAASDSTILIQGETGAGKEVLARAIHDLSPRRNGPFIAVNCGALPDTLLESELFGYKAGAFTGADRDKPGRFALAEGGTLLLDEIGDVSPALQMRLLRVLEQRAYEPLGGTAAVKANVRVLAATHRDLSALVAEGRFRQDLYYRINVLRLDLPPLRRRKEDIPPLVDHFITRFNHLRGKAVTGISEDALSILMAHDYPGNIRELENIIERAFVLCPEGRIDGRHLADDLVARAVRVQVSGGIDATRKAVEAQAIQDALRRTDGNREKAAALLGVHKSTLFRKIKALGIRPPDKDGRAGRKRRR